MKKKEKKVGELLSHSRDELCHENAMFTILAGDMNLLKSDESDGEATSAN